MVKTSFEIGGKKITIELSRWRELHRSQLDGEKIFIPEYISFHPENFQYIEKAGLPYIAFDGKADILSIYSGVVRQFPVFYFIKGKEIFLCDNAEKIPLKNRRLDFDSLLEFLGLGYTAERKTLFADISQLQAGELVEISKNGMKINDEYLYHSYNISNDNFSVLSDELLSILKNIFEELMVALNGKLAVVPLSGGYDSRLVAAMLKMTGYENVICANYGAKGNTTETPVSKIVCEKLKYRWLGVEYTDEMWQDFLKSSDFERYIFDFRPHSFSAFPQIHELPMIRKIADETGNPEDVVIISGHSADFLAGSHIPQKISAKHSKIDAASEIFLYKQYRLREKPIHNKILQSVRDEISRFAISDEPYKLAQLINWRERQAKIIVNSNRMYEFYGFQWAMPFWDRRLVEFFSRGYLALLKNKELYDVTLENLIFNKFGIDFDAPQNKRRRRLRKFFPMRYFSEQFIDRVKKIVRGKYVNPIGVDRFFRHLRPMAEEKFPDGYGKLKKIVSENFPYGDGISPHTPIVDFVASMFLEKFEL
ncbi:hypothetical protein DRQ26_06625 [bacterium]|nr:MAG: hypothetical protein DRQ26_06625 [bacterium]